MRLPFVASLVFLLTTLGCSPSGPQTYPVRGIVRFPDGKLLREGSVEFEIMGTKTPVTARGVIEPDGSFVLGTYTLDDGALAGKHRAVVIAGSVVGNGVERPDLLPPPTLDPKYRSYRESGLEFEVAEKTNNFIIEVDYVPKTEE